MCVYYLYIYMYLIDVKARVWHPLFDSQTWLKTKFRSCQASFAG